MKKKITNIALVLVFVLGFLILMYPTLSNYYNKAVGSYTIGQYDKDVESLEVADLDEIFENAKEYNQNLLLSPTSIKSGKPQDKNYLSQLKINDEESVMGYIEIKKIKIKLPIYHGTSEPVLQKGVGHLEGTSLPIGGNGTHAVLTGHTGLSKAKLFTDLVELEEGDIITIKVLNEATSYKVSDIEVVLPKDVDNLRPVENEDKITLMTCTPYGVNSHRLLIHANRYYEEVKTEENTEFKLPIGIMSLFTLLVIIYFLYKKYIIE